MKQKKTFNTIQLIMISLITTIIGIILGFLFGNIKPEPLAYGPYPLKGNEINEAIKYIENSKNQFNPDTNYTKGILFDIDNFENLLDKFKKTRDSVDTKNTVQLGIYPAHLSKDGQLNFYIIPVILNKNYDTALKKGVTVKHELITDIYDQLTIDEKKIIHNNIYNFGNRWP